MHRTPLSCPSLSPAQLPFSSSHKAGHLSANLISSEIKVYPEFWLLNSSVTIRTPLPWITSIAFWLFFESLLLLLWNLFSAQYSEQLFQMESQINSLLYLRHLMVCLGSLEVLTKAYKDLYDPIINPALFPYAHCPRLLMWRLKALVLDSSVPASLAASLFFIRNSMVLPHCPLDFLYTSWNYLSLKICVNADFLDLYSNITFMVIEFKFITTVSSTPGTPSVAYLTLFPLLS